jgi:sensor histidine kinase YesM
VQISVTDTGPGLNDVQPRATSSTGVGLANIRDRLVQAYGPRQRFEAQPGTAGGFTVTIEVPYETEPKELA